VITLHYHPLSSYCQKALIGMYELGVPFEGHVVDLGEPDQRAAFYRLWPMGQFPVIVDGDRAIPESSIILEHLDRDRRLVPNLAARAADRFYDLHVHVHMQKIIGDRLRPDGAHDPTGVAHARGKLAAAYAVADAELRERAWAAGDTFTLGDCAAAPSLFFANKVAPFADHAHLAAYFERVSAHPSVARTFAEAAPYLEMFPG
jgi:glutathione S-transferase